MKSLKINTLCVLFLFSPIVATLNAQTDNGDEIYYSNPQKGIKAKPPKAYVDTTIVNKSDNITVEIVGEDMNAVDSINSATAQSNTLDTYYDYAYTARINRFHRGMGFDYFDCHYTDLYWYTGNPLYWGTSIYYAWDPWYSPWWNSWYYPGWGGSMWLSYHPWGWGPYWSFGYGAGWAYGWGWGSPWYYDPFYYPGFYGYYGWGGAYYWSGHGGHNGSFGHHYLGNSRSKSNPTYRSTDGGTSPNPAPRGQVRRGGVDLNNGGRGHASGVSGTGTVGGRGSNTSNGRTSTTSRYAKPQSAVHSTGRTVNSRNTNTEQGSMNRSTTMTGSRFENGSRQTTRSSNFENGSRQTTTRSSNFENGSRQTTTRSSSFSSPSSGRSSGSSFGGGHSGGSHSSGSRGGGSSRR